MASVPKGMDFNDLLDKEDVDLIFTLEEEIAAGSFGTVYKVRLCSLPRAYLRDSLVPNTLAFLGTTIVHLFSISRCLLLFLPLSLVSRVVRDPSCWNMMPHGWL